MDQQSISVYTDGACKNNGRPNAIAGIGVYFGDNDDRNVSERIAGNQTNNAAELSAIIRACDILRCKITDRVVVDIHTDSEYAIKCATTYGAKLKGKQWKNGKKVIPNLELVKQLHTIVSCSPNIRFHHVRAHTGHTDIHSVSNAHADRLANEAVEKKENNEEPVLLQVAKETFPPAVISSVLMRLQEVERRLQQIENALA